MRLNLKNWADESKVHARFKTIIIPYRNIFGDMLLDNCQYWSLCGQLSIGQDVTKNSELDQMVSEGLINPAQFYGVEINEDIYKINVAAISGTKYSKAHMFHGELADVMDAELGKGNLNPGIIYLDTLQEPKYAVIILGKILEILSHTSGPTMLAWNVILRNPHSHRVHNWDDVKKAIERNDLCRVHIGRWQQYKEKTVFKYDGTGRSSTTMGTVVLINRD